MQLTRFNVFCVSLGRECQVCASYAPACATFVPGCPQAMPSLKKPNWWYVAQTFQELTNQPCRAVVTQSVKFDMQEALLLS